MKRISAIFLATALLAPTTLSSHNTKDAIAKQALKDKIQEKAIDKAASLIEKTVRRCAGPSKKGILCSLIGGGASIFESKNGQVKEKIRNKGPMPARDHVVPHPDTSHVQKHTNGKHGIQGKKENKLTAKEAAKKQFRKEAAGLEKRVLRDNREGGTGKITGVGTGKGGTTYRPKKDGSYSVGRPGKVKHFRPTSDGGYTVNQR